MVEIKYSISDLSNLNQLSPLFIYNRYFTAIGPINYEAYALTMNLIRLVDLAIQEYANGRNVLNNFVASKNSSLATHLIIIAAGHFEVCINTLKRVINYFKRLRGHANVPPPLKDLLPGNSKVLTGDVEGRVTAMRDAIEHLENRIQRGEITFGQPLCMMPVENGIELGKHKILFTELAEWLKEVHDCAKKLSYYREPN